MAANGAMTGPGGQVEAESIPQQLKGGLNESEELRGMDKMLQGGLLQFLLSINPYLPRTPSQIVKFKDVSYSEVRPTEIPLMTLGKTLGLMVAGPFLKMETAHVDILKDVSGYLMPGTLTLFMGPRGCGKSTLHKFLGGRMGDVKARSGDVTYNGLLPHEITVQRVATVVDESDYFVPVLSVAETLNLAKSFTHPPMDTQVPPEFQELIKDATDAGHEPKMGIILHMMALTKLMHHPVGSDQMPTTTADERHRVSSAEMLTGGYDVFYFDELNGGGTDETTTYEMVRAIQIYARVRQFTMAVSLVQPSPEVFALFDRIVLLNRGQVIFQGHRLDAVPYFASLGYMKPEFVDTPDFLNDLAGPFGDKYLAQGFQALDHEGFVAAYLASPFHRDVMRVVDSGSLQEEIFASSPGPLGLRLGPGPVVASVDSSGPLAHPSDDISGIVQAGDQVVGVADANGALNYGPSDINSLNSALAGNNHSRIQVTRPFQPLENPKDLQSLYVNGLWAECRMCTWRFFVGVWRNKFEVYSRLFTIVFLALFSGTLIWRASHHANLDTQLRRGIFFGTIMPLTTIAIGQMPGYFGERAVWYKWSDAKFCRPFAYFFGMYWGTMPFHFFEATLWTLATYFMCGLSLADGGWHFWIFYICCFFLVTNAVSLARFCAYFGPDFNGANAIFGLFLTLQAVMAGNLIARHKVPNYWIWWYYIDSFQWIFTTMEVNEFDSSSYNQKCSTVGANWPMMFGGQTAYQAANYPFCIGHSGTPLAPHAPIPADITVGHAWQIAGDFYRSIGWIAVGIPIMLFWHCLWNLLTYWAIANVRHRPPNLEGELAETKNVKDTAEPMDLENGARSKIESQVPVVPVVLSWHDLSYDWAVPMTKHTATVFSGVSGWARPSEMLAIIGNRESGKEHLLNALSGRRFVPTGLSGSILVNGYPKDQATFAHVSAMVERSDAYFPLATVRESMEFSAAMRLGPGAGKPQIRAAVDEALWIMELTDLQHRQVKSLGAGIAAESLRRMAIAVEIASNPSVLFLDEPTTGLDSRHALLVIVCLRRFANTGRTVISTVRNITYRMANQYDNALILNRHGQTVYFGSVGPNCSNVVAYFNSVPGGTACPPYVNPLTFALDVVGDGVTGRIFQDKDYTAAWAESDLYHAQQKQFAALQESSGSAGPMLDVRGHSASVFTQFSYNFVRMQVTYWRNVDYAMGRVMVAVLFGLIYGSLFWQLKISTQGALVTRAGQMFDYTATLGVFNAVGVISQISGALTAFKRERASYSYVPFFFDVAWFAAEIPYLAVSILIFCAIANGMSGLATNSVGQFFLFWFILFEIMLVVTTLGMFLAVAFPFPPMAAALVPIFISIWIPTSGIGSNPSSQRGRIEDYYAWIYWSNPFQYAYSAMMCTSFWCNPRQYPACTPIPLPGMGPPLTKSPPGCPCEILTDSQVYQWDAIVALKALDHSRVPLDMMALALFALLFYALFGASLRFLRHNK